MDLFPNDIVRERFILNQLFLLDDFEQFPQTFALSRFDPQLNGYVAMGRSRRSTTIFNRDIQVYDTRGEPKQLFFEQKREPNLIVQLENILHLHTLLMSEFQTPFLYPIYLALKEAIVELLEYLTRIQLFMLIQHPQPILFVESIGHFWEPYEHVFFESLFQTMTIFMMQCPSGTFVQLFHLFRSSQVV